MTRFPRAVRFARWAPAAILLSTLCVSGCSEEVVSVLPVASVAIEPSELSLMEGGSGSLSAVVRGSGGEVLQGRTVTWSSEVPEIAVVDATGQVTAVAPGQTTIRGSSGGVVGTATVTVLDGPTIHLFESSLSFEGVSGRGDRLERQVAVTNSQGGTLSGLSVSVEQNEDTPEPWLQASLVSSTAPTSVIVDVRVGDLPPGAYSGSVVLESEVAVNSPQVIAVELQVEEHPPELVLDPSSVALNGVTGDVEPASVSVDVRNAGSGTLASLTASVLYPDGEPEGWLEGELESTETPTTLVVRASARTLSPGTYRGVVQVASPDAPNEADSVEVVFNVSPRTEGQAGPQGVLSPTPTEPEVAF